MSYFCYTDVDTLTHEGNLVNLMIIEITQIRDVYCNFKSNKIITDNITEELMPGATTGDPTHDKVMWKRTVKQGFRTQGAP